MPYHEIQMLVPARGDVTGFVFPMKWYHMMRKKDPEFMRLLDEQWMQATSYLYMSQILYRDGECITRISYLLYHVYYYKDYDAEVFPISQEELAYTVNASKSQFKRALTYLKNEGELSCNMKKL